MLTFRDDYLDASYGARAAPVAAPRVTRTTLGDCLRTAPLRCVEDRDHIFTEGNPKTHVYQIESGAVSLYRLLPDGRRQIVDFALAGDIIGLGLGGLEDCSALALTPTRVRSLAIGVLSGLMRRQPDLAMSLCEAMAQNIVACREHLVCVVHRSALERVATFLADMSRRNLLRNRDPMALDLPMTRTDIGDFLGLTIETVSRTFTRLRAMRIIVIDAGATVRICNMEGLRLLSTAGADAGAGQP